MTTDIIRTAEFVLPGHPDKLADAIADAIVERAMQLERRALVGVEVALHRDAVFIDGRVACQGAEGIDFQALVRQVYASAGYGKHFAPEPDSLKITTDLCLGPLWEGEAAFREVADDQSIVTGYACSLPGTDMLPVEHALARTLAIRLHQLRDLQPGLRLGPDGKLIVFVRESHGGTRFSLERISVSQQHAANWRPAEARQTISGVLLETARHFAKRVPGLTLSPDLVLQLNDAGDFVEGGPHGDNGLSGKKLVADFYGPRVPIGGGAMSGKDLWKADRAGPLIARDLAIEGVQRFGMTECTVTLAICPGDRAFRVVSVVGANGAPAPAGVAAQLEELFDLRLASRGESELGELVERARWGHFVEVPKLRATTRSPEQAVAATP